MVRKKFVSLSLVALALLMLIPAAAIAQTGIAGVVKDTTGAVLPGVTVEASSPALIEKVRTVVTDDQGRYKVVDLRPGIYSVTFTLTGFSTVKREGIELTTNFTANVNTDMRVGELQETVTVSGRSPVVDVQNVIQQRVVTKDVIEALPTARTQQFIAALIPGMVIGTVSRPVAQDVGGAAGDALQTLAIHGGQLQDMVQLIDGIPQHTMTGQSTGGINMDTGVAQEYSFELGAISAESATGGVRVNTIPKEGGNRFAGTVFAAFTNHNLQSDNSSDELRARGLPEVNQLDKVWDVNPSFGGPIKQDKLWFFSSFRHWGSNDRVAGMWFDKDPLDFVYTPDLSRRAIDDLTLASQSLRLTWQATQKNKLAFFGINQSRCICHRRTSATLAPEAASRALSPVDYLMQVNWNAPVTSRLLLEGGAQRYKFVSNQIRQPGVSVDRYSVQELSTNLVFRAAAEPYFRHDNWIYNYRGSLSYVTGSHAAKVGFTLQQGNRVMLTDVNGDINLQLLNGVPRSVTVWATPYRFWTNLNAALGLFAQDQWTIKRLTLNGGVRFDHHNASIPEQHLPAVQFVPARDFAAINDVPNWTDLSPRLGASYDLFGTGKTALKVTLSRYVAAETVGFTNAINPVNTSVNSASRTWTDLNGDFIPQENELGPLSNASFGTVVIRTRYDDAVREGFGSRFNNWETSAGLQHELLPQMSVNATYFGRWYGNFTVTDNLAVTPADYDPYCITAPVDARLPGGGGQQICGLYDITPAKFGQVNNLVTFDKAYGKQTAVYNGVDLTVNARLPHGGLVSGGLNTGRTATNNCFVIDSPQALYFCEVTPLFLTQVKFLGSIGLPWDLQAAATFQSLPGPEITASYVVPNAQIRPSLGRNLAAGANATTTIELVQPGTRYEERLYQLDVRLSKIFRVGRTRIQANFDLYNALNVNTVLRINTRYGPAWQQPTYVLPGRLFKFGGQVNF